MERCIVKSSDMRWMSLALNRYRWSYFEWLILSGVRLMAHGEYDDDGDDKDDDDYETYMLFI